MIEGSQLVRLQPISILKFSARIFRSRIFFGYKMHTVVENHSFRRAAETAGLSDEELTDIIDEIASNPARGDIIRGMGGARKIRAAGRGRGKRAGYRIITLYTDANTPVILTYIFSKSEPGVSRSLFP